MNSLDWKPISQDPPVKHGWFAVAALPPDHHCRTLEQINEWRSKYGFQKAWFDSAQKGQQWFPPGNLPITHWTELAHVPTLTEKPKWPS